MRCSRITCAFSQKNYYRQKKDLLSINTNGVFCVKYPKSQRALHTRPCMIIMPQLYQHKILFQAHGAMVHQGIAKVLARVQERRIWPGIRKTIGQYVNECLTCQQVHDKTGDVRFHLKNIQSRYFNELLQCYHMEICPSNNRNTGISVIIDLFSKFAEAVPCNHEEYDAATTSKIFCKNGLPVVARRLARMQSDNASTLPLKYLTNFSEISTVCLSKIGHYYIA